MSKLKEMKELAKEIRDFLHMHGKRDVNDPSEWNSPDAAQLELFAKVLDGGAHPAGMPHSEWGSGGYKPYNSDVARQRHDRLLEKCAEMLKSFVPDSLRSFRCPHCNYIDSLAAFKLSNGHKRCPECQRHIDDPRVLVSDK
jgi:hypothetical protein